MEEMEMNILITNEAKRELDKLLENSDKKCIRILTRCITMTSDAKIDIELDEPNSNDNLYDVDGYKIIINKVLFLMIFLIEILTRSFIFISNLLNFSIGHFIYLISISSNMFIMSNNNNTFSHSL